MERCYIKIIIGWIGIVCLSIVPPQINAQDYRIAQIIPYLSDDFLKVDVTLDNILQDDILKTLLAGIPLDFKIQVSLLDDGQHTISRRVFNSKVSYDVWEEHFWILGFNEKLLDFDNLERVKNWVSTNHTLAFVEQNSLTPQNTYTVHITLQIIILGKQESQQLKWWIENSD
ncbi:MAG: DUF4390 domain-containing protein, partial [bacterium]